MSQPLSGALGRKLAVTPNPERGPKLPTRESTETVERSLPLRTAVALVLMCAGVIVTPVGVAMVAGAGAALIVVGVLALVLGVLVGYF